MNASSAHYGGFSYKYLVWSILIDFFANVVVITTICSGGRGAEIKVQV